MKIFLDKIYIKDIYSLFLLLENKINNYNDNI
jgi:hypothetical protein